MGFQGRGPWDPKGGPWDPMGGGPWDPRVGPWTHWPLGTHWPMDLGPGPMGPRYWLLAIGWPAGWRPTPGNDDDENENDELSDTSRPLGQRAQGSHTPCGAAPTPLTLIK